MLNDRELKEALEGRREASDQEKYEATLRSLNRVNDGRVTMRPSPNAMPDFFVSKHLSPDELAGLYQQAKRQAEAEVAGAWMNVVLAPNDPVRVTMYEKAKGALADLEADERRLLGGE